MRFRIKRLYLFIIQTFLPVFIMTFGICLFVVLLQFIWQYIDDFVGKGLDNITLAKLFLYAALSLIPMALPLSILLASLMSFGSLGERLELLAIKASGISLLKAMKPLIVLVAFIAIGAFFFQNNIMPRINVKFDALLISIKQKSPELDIPEGSFYDGIDNYSLYVQHKDRKTKILHDVMIYDTSEGFQNMSVFVCDSALMRVSESKDFLMLNLYHGQRFSNFNQSQQTHQSYNSSSNQFISYGRENFSEKAIIIPFDTKFNKMDESAFSGTQVSQNLTQLGHSIDSMNHQLDSLNRIDRRTMFTSTYLSYRNTNPANTNHYNSNKTKVLSSEYDHDKTSDIANNISPKKSINIKGKTISKSYFDSIVNTYTVAEKMVFARTALNDAQGNDMTYKYVPISKSNLQAKLRMFEISVEQKYTLSFACLVFFFIGAPLGAIIRKGGLGTPTIVSVLLFMIYYILNNVGYKFSRDAVSPVWVGMWLSSFLLFPLGVFLTYKAINDSELFNPEFYNKLFRKIFFIKPLPKLTSIQRDNIINQIPDLDNSNIDSNIIKSLSVMDSDLLREILRNHKKYHYDQITQTVALSILKSRGADLSDVINLKDHHSVETILRFFNRNSIFTIIAYIILILLMVVNKIRLIHTGSLTTVFEIIYVIAYIRSIYYYSAFYKISDKKSKLLSFFISILTFICYPIMYIYIRILIIKGLHKMKM